MECKFSVTLDKADKEVRLATRTITKRDSRDTMRMSHIALGATWLKWRLPSVMQ